MTSQWAQWPGNFCLHSSQEQNWGSWEVGRSRVGWKPLPCRLCQTCFPFIYPSVHPPHSPCRKALGCFKEERSSLFPDTHVECLLRSRLPLGQIAKAISPGHLRVSELGRGKGLTPSGSGSKSFAPFGGSVAQGLVRGHQQY